MLKYKVLHLLDRTKLLWILGKYSLLIAAVIRIP